MVAAEAVFTCVVEEVGTAEAEILTTEITLVRLLVDCSFMMGDMGWGARMSCDDFNRRSKGEESHLA